MFTSGILNRSTIYLRKKCSALVRSTHQNHAKKSICPLTGGDKIELPFSKFVHTDGTALVAAIKECWMQSKSIERLPKGGVLVVGGPDYTTIKLQNGSLPAPDDVLESTYIHAVTRLLLHTNGISIDQEQNVVLIQSST